MPFETAPSNGRTIGIVALIVLIAADLLFLFLLSQTGLSLLSVLWLVLILASLPLIAIVAYRIYGLSNAGYFLSQNALTINWGDLHEVIPMGDIETIEANPDADSLPSGLWWPGAYVGRGQHANFGPLIYFATAQPEGQLLVRLAQGAYVISPTEPAEFLKTYNEAHEKGITETVPYITRRAKFHDWPLWRSPSAIILMAAPLVLAVLLFAYVAFQADIIAGEVPLRFDAARLPTDIGPATRLILLPIIAGVVWFANTFAGVVAQVALNDRLAAYTAWGGGLLVQMALWVAALSLTFAR